MACEHIPLYYSAVSPNTCRFCGEQFVVDDNGSWAKQQRGLAITFFSQENKMATAAPVRVTVIDAVLGALRANPQGLTAKEISEKTGIVRNSISPWTAPLLAAGLIEKAGRRDGMTVWRIK